MGSSAAVIPLVTQAAGAASSLVGSANKASRDKAALSIQQKNAQISLLLDRVQIEERKRQVQEDLRKAVAATTVKANSRGIKISGTSQENILDAAFSDEKSKLGLLNFQDRISTLKAQSTDDAIRRRKKQIDGKFKSDVAGQAVGVISKFF